MLLFCSMELLTTGYCVLALAGPEEVVGGAAGPLLHEGAVGGRAAHDIQALAAMAGHKLEETARGAPLPLLVRLSVACPLDDAGAVRRGYAVDIEAQTAVAAHDVEKAAADVD